MHARRVWVGTSWKMNKTIGETRDYIALLNRATLSPAIQTFVLPPLTALSAARDALAPNVSVLLGAQNAHWAPEGAWTGEVSMPMVRDAGATIVEIGHFERREQFGESDATVALKVRAALAAGLVPLICVGETRSERESGNAEEFIIGQLARALEGLAPAQVERVLVAYEPTWAVGELGTPASSTEIAPVAHAASEWLGAQTGGTTCVPFLYGGSVDRENAAELVRVPRVDGVFVGRAAWEPAGLIEIAEIVADAITAGQT